MFGVILFGLILFGTVYTSWSLMPVSFPRLGKILPIISSNTFFSSLSLCVFFSSFPSLPSLLLIFSFSFLYNVSVSAYFFPESESEVAQLCPRPHGAYQAPPCMEFSFKILKCRHHPTKKSSLKDFPGGLVAKTLHSQWRGPGFDPWSGN